MPVTEHARPLLGVLLPGEGQTQVGGEVSLVVPRSCVSWSVSYALRVHGRNYVVTPLRAVDSGDDFDNVSFSLQPGRKGLSKPTASAAVLDSRLGGRGGRP